MKDLLKNLKTSLKGFYGFSKILAITVACHGLVWEPLAMALPPQSESASEKAAQTEFFNLVKKKDLTYGELFAKMKDSLTPEQIAGMEGFIAQNKNTKVGEIEVVRGTGPDGNPTVKIIWKNHENVTAIIEPVGTEQVALKINGIPFSEKELVEYDPMQRKMNRMYKDDITGGGMSKKRDPSSVINPFSVDPSAFKKQTAKTKIQYMNAARQLVISMESWDKMRTKNFSKHKVKKKRKTASAEPFFTELFPNAFAARADLAPVEDSNQPCETRVPPDPSEKCVFAGYFDTYSVRPAEGDYSCAGSTVDNYKEGCEDNKVRCSADLFGFDESGKEHCASLGGRHYNDATTASCDVAAPLEDEGSFNKIYHSVKGAGAPDDLPVRQQFLNELLQKHKNVLAVCYPGADVNDPEALTSIPKEQLGGYLNTCPDQRAACETIRRRGAVLAGLAGEINKSGAGGPTGGCQPNDFEACKAKSTPENPMTCLPDPTGRCQCVPAPACSAEFVATCTGGQKCAEGPPPVCACPQYQKLNKEGRCEDECKTCSVSCTTAALIGIGALLAGFFICKLLLCKGGKHKKGGGKKGGGGTKPTGKGKENTPDPGTGDRPGAI